MIAQINTLAISIKLSLRDDFKLDVHDVWSHKVSPYLRNWWSYLLWKVPNAVERSSREQREWIGERENRKRNQKSEEIYTFFHEASAVDVFVSRRARTLEFFRWRRKHHISVQRWYDSFLSLSLCVCVCLLFFCLFVRVWGVCDDVLESVPQSVSRSIEKEKNSHVKNQHNSFSLVPHKLFCRAEKKKNKKKASEKRRIGNTWHAHSVVN